MTAIPIYKVCPKCCRRYLWNPAAGRTGCPHSGGTRKIVKGLLGIILKETIGDRKK